MSIIGIIGGSGLYDIEGLENVEERQIDTPFGATSDSLIGGQLAGKQVWFIPRHGKGHRILPTEIPHRANLWALKSLGVKWVIGVGAVGSLKEELPPMHIVLPDQYYDRTTQRTEHTFFGNGIVAHLPFGYPTNPLLRNTLAASCAKFDLPCQNGGTYVNMDGPAFSTRAESETNRSHGFDLIGMTNLAEAKLAREAEMAYASLCMVTDYDCWKDQEVDVQEIIGYLTRNSNNAKKVLVDTITNLPVDEDQPEFGMLDFSIITPKDLWPEEVKTHLSPILARLLD